MAAGQEIKCREFVGAREPRSTANIKCHGMGSMVYIYCKKNSTPAYSTHGKLATAQCTHGATHGAEDVLVVGPRKRFCDGRREHGDQEQSDHVDVNAVKHQKTAQDGSAGAHGWLIGWGEGVAGGGAEGGLLNVLISCNFMMTHRAPHKSLPPPHRKNFEKLRNLQTRKGLTGCTNTAARLRGSNPKRTRKRAGANREAWMVTIRRLHVHSSVSDVNRSTRLV